MTATYDNVALLVDLWLEELETPATVHPKDANMRWARYVKLAAHQMDDGDRSNAKMRAMLAELADHFPDEMAPILAKWDGGVSALRQRLNHMHTKGYEREHPDNWPDRAQQNRVLLESGWYDGRLL